MSYGIYKGQRGDISGYRPNNRPIQKSGSINCNYDTYSASHQQLVQDVLKQVWGGDYGSKRVELDYEGALL